MRHSYTNAVRGFSATMSAAEAKQLEADPSVAYVEQNRVMTASDTQSPVPSWGLDRIDQRGAAARRLVHLRERRRRA